MQASGCAAPPPKEIDTCEAIRRAPELLGKPIKLLGWYGSTGFWSAIGSGDCRETLIEPKFGPSVIVDTTGLSRSDGTALRISLKNDVVPFGGFHGAFFGVLRKRTGAVQSGSVPLDAAPNLHDMPYVMVIDRVADVKFGRATFFEEPPPPPRS